MRESPFKFLSAYGKDDLSLFFGREKETEELYEMTFDTRLMLIVGASGTGKSSLIQCGLSNKISEARWKDIFIRRETNINLSVETVITNELKRCGGDLLGDSVSIVEKLSNIYKATFQPIYLVFDQFEELFIVNPDEGEQVEFFEFVNDILQSAIACKIILIMRDEFITHLWKYEKIVPTLFLHRFRIEQMRSSEMEDVIRSTLSKLSQMNVIESADNKITAAKVIEKMTDSKAGLKLTYLQVYLDRLYNEAKKEGRTPPLFSPSLVDSVGSFEDIIGTFLSSQLEILEEKLGRGKKGIPIRILSELITDEKTKKVVDDVGLEELRSNLEITADELQMCLQYFENMRILRQFD